ncbi:MAG: PIN domain-containing protein [Candidatus Micrarchaeota archaeon]|nr:PIN domain-containing protein [Candidatus Micrarchaeota archaeon]
MSTRYVVDSWAWIEYFRGSRYGDIAKRHMDAGELFTSSFTVSEVTSKFDREGLDVDEAFKAIISKSAVVSVDAADAKEAGMLHSSTKKLRPNFSLGDAFVLHTAKKLGAKVLTGDPDFKGLREAVMLI